MNVENLKKGNPETQFKSADMVEQADTTDLKSVAKG